MRDLVMLIDIQVLHQRPPNAEGLAASLCTKGPHKCKPSQELLPKYIEQDAKQGPSSQFAERAGSGLQSCSSSKELRGLSVRAQVRVQAFSLVLCCEDFLNPASFMQRDESQRIEVQYRVSVSRRSVTHLHSPFSSPCRILSRRATRGRALA